MLVFFRVVISLLALAGKNIALMFLSKKMILWGAEKAANLTDTLIDDIFVEAVKAGLESDQDAFISAIEKLSIKHIEGVKNGD